MALLCALWGGCGIQGPPATPRVEQPQKIGDFAAAQRGAAFDLTFTRPALAADGQRLSKQLEIEVFRAITKPGEKPPDSFGPGAPWLSLSPKVLDSHTEGDKVVFHAALSKPEFDHSLGSTYFFGVRGLTRGFRNRAIEGEISNIAHVRLLAVSGPVENLQIKTTENALELSWTPPGQSLGGQALAPVAGYRVYWSPTGKPGSFQLRGEPTTAAFSDPQFAFEHDSYYHVCAVFKEGVEIALSDDSSVAHVLPHDTFAPAPPTNLSGIYSAGAVQLVWTANTEPDLGGYNVYRREKGGAFQKINTTLLRTPTFEDRTAQAGHEYYYRVTAVDLTQNESGPSEEFRIEIQ